MGYMHIDNLYKNQDILMFKECYALEKIHGTSAHIAWRDGKLTFFSGGEKHDAFVALFNVDALTAKFAEIGNKEMVVYGEAYGGKCQGMSKTYGDRLRFVAFDVAVEGVFLNVPTAEMVVVGSLELEFVHYRKVSTDLAALDAERDAYSEQAVRNGITIPTDDVTWRMREGVVLRPLVEMCRPGRDNGRIIAKHKRPEFSERKTIPEIDPTKREIADKADQIAEEWVTEMRLSHVLDKLGNPTDLAETGKVIAAMVEDVVREASGEIVDSKAARRAIGSRAAKLYKDRVTKITQEAR